MLNLLSLSYQLSIPRAVGYITDEWSQSISMHEHNGGVSLLLTQLHTRSIIPYNCYIVGMLLEMLLHDTNHVNKIRVILDCTLILPSEYIYLEG